jgi:hypothetical protein
MMPSFVPYADLDVCSNWFRLDNPHCKLMDSIDAVKLSAKVKSIQNCAHNVGNADCYRDGELDRLFRRSQQLESRLPLQSTAVQVPYENTLGGFAMFNSGVTDLAPELLGWYGTPAINLDAPTTLFLIGDHFSVHQTRVLAGGQEVAATEMLSRQVMKVTIPAGAQAIVQETGIVSGGWTPNTAPKAAAPPAPAGPGRPVAPGKQPVPPIPQDPGRVIPVTGLVAVGGLAAAAALPLDLGGKKPPVDDATTVKEVLGPDYLYVDIQLATPYGVTGHLLVPAAHLPKTGASGGGADASGSALPGWATKEMALGFVYKGTGIAPSDQPTYQPNELAINLGPHFELDGIISVTLKMKVGGGAKADLQPLVIAVDKNFDPKTHTLKIKDGDLNNLVTLIFAELQFQFGPETTKPPCPVTVEATVTGAGIPDTKLFNSLKVSWVKAAAAAKANQPGG